MPSKDNSQAGDGRLSAGAAPALAGKRIPIVCPEGLPGEEYAADVSSIVASGQLTNGSRVRAFEQAASEFLGVPECIAVANCSSGLLLTLRALGLTGEVILPSFTFHVTAHAVVWNNLKPVFADCDPRTFCISAEAVRAQLTPRTAAILAVHMYGHPADVESLEAIAADSGIPLVFDAAHAFGSRFNGTPIGGFGTAEIFSFSPTKLLVAGEGGLIATRDRELARLLRAGRNYGDTGNYDPDMLGFNARMSELHAALAQHGLGGLEARIARRNQIRQRYEDRLAAVPGLRFQTIRECCLSTCKDFSILVNPSAFGASRDWLFEGLTAENIEVRRYFWPPVHRQKLYRELWDGQPLPATDFISDGVVSLPIYSSLSDTDVDAVCGAIERLHVLARKDWTLREERR